MRRKSAIKYFSACPLNQRTGAERRGEKENASERQLSWIEAMVTVAAIHLPPLDNGDLVSKGFRWSVDFLAGVDPLTFQALLKVNLSGVITCGVLFWLWLEGWRERIVAIPVACVCFFLGLWIPVAWIEINIRALKAFIVLLLIFGVIGLSFALPFFFTRHVSRQVKPRWIIFGTLVSLIMLQIVLSRYGH